MKRFAMLACQALSDLIQFALAAPSNPLLEHEEAALQEALRVLRKLAS